MDLDFSKLDSLAYRGFAGEEGKRARDTFIEQGFTIIEGEKTPFDGLGELEGIKPSGKPVESKLEPLAAMYEAAYSYHKRHAPQLRPEYWQEAVADIGGIVKRFNNDAFMIALLSAVYGDMERGYKRLQQAR